MQTASRSRDEPFPFLRLPREIRDQIYTYSLVLPGRTSACRRVWRWHSMSLAPGVARVNKQIHLEASRVLYGESIFVFMSPKQLRTFQNEISAENCAKVRSISIDITVRGACPNLSPRSVPESTPSKWTRALEESCLSHLHHLEVGIGGDPNLPKFLGNMSLTLHRDLKGILQRNESESPTPRLILKTYKTADKRGPFYSKGEVITIHWDEHLDSMKLLEELSK
ncbi:hypothetical protein BJ875DRAFT_256313 [Amylocarpus encephaloides]|uniref:F-box domain-containing protein n=1 Tax=Amylocarpus encephaloides TaxID=45428 RepID=A0A9P7YMN6_9HELO|nr:hypothetical protein BJ875DRAFT_256313 [Amylocarpus encephaloides]